MPKPTRAAAAALLLCTLGLVPLLSSSPVGEAQPAGNPLQVWRDRARDPRGSGVVIEGRVVGATSDVISTSIVPDQWQGLLYTGDLVTVRIAGRALRARFLEAAAYADLQERPGAADGLDADVVCAVDGQGALVIVGLGGGLAQWVQAKAPMRVILEAR